MSVLHQLASALGRRDEAPNQELARRIVEKGDAAAIQELVDHLADKNKDVQSDCIKVLYEIGDARPALIAGYIEQFLPHLNSKNNRMQWGAMTALGAIVREEPAEIFQHLPRILDAADKGSVITKDHAVNILIELCKTERTKTQAFPLLIEQLSRAATNQLPMYAENARAVVDSSNKTLFIETLRARLDEVEKESKKQRIEKVIRQLNK